MLSLSWPGAPPARLGQSSALPVDSNFPLATVRLGDFEGDSFFLRRPPLLRRLSGDGLERGARPLGGWSCIAVDLGLGLHAPLSRRRMLFRRLGFWLPSPSSASARGDDGVGSGDGRGRRCSPSASMPDWGFCSSGLIHGGDVELVDFPAAEEARCVAFALIMGESGVDPIPCLGFGLRWVAGMSLGGGGVISVLRAGGFVAGAGLCFISAKGWELPVLPVCGIWIPAAGLAGGGGLLLLRFSLERMPMVFQRIGYGSVHLGRRLLRLYMCWFALVVAAGGSGGRRRAAVRWRRAAVRCDLAVNREEPGSNNDLQRSPCTFLLFSFVSRLLLYLGRECTVIQI